MWRSHTNIFKFRGTGRKVIMEFEKYVKCGEDDEEIVTYEVDSEDLQRMFIGYIKQGKIKD